MPSWPTPQNSWHGITCSPGREKRIGRIDDVARHQHGVDVGPDDQQAMDRIGTGGPECDRVSAGTSEAFRHERVLLPDLRTVTDHRPRPRCRDCFRRTRRPMQGLGIDGLDLALRHRRLMEADERGHADQRPTMTMDSIAQRRSMRAATASPARDPSAPPVMFRRSAARTRADKRQTTARARWRWRCRQPRSRRRDRSGRWRRPLVFGERGRCGGDELIMAPSVHVAARSSLAWRAETAAPRLPHAVRI